MLAQVLAGLPAMLPAQVAKVRGALAAKQSSGPAFTPPARGASAFATTPRIAELDPTALGLGEVATP